MKIKLAECFYSFQGEGPDSGKKMIILRFKHCNRIYNNIACNFCDTIEKLKTTEEKEYNLQDIQNKIDYFGPDCGLIITGGEPTFSIGDINNFDQTIAMLENLKYSIANVESNGFNLLKLVEHFTDNKNINFIYSPKIFDLDELIKERENIEKMKLIDSIKFKVVYNNDGLTHNILKLLAEYKLHGRVFLMIKGKTKEELLKNSDEVLKVTSEYKFNFSSRLHIIHHFS